MDIDFRNGGRLREKLLELRAADPGGDGFGLSNVLSEKANEISKRTSI